MINLPEHCHTQHTSTPDGETTNHTWTTPTGTWTLDIATSRNRKIVFAAITGPDTLIKRTYRPQVDEQEIELLLHVLGAIGAIKLDNPIEAEVEDELPHCENCACGVVEAHIEEDGEEEARADAENLIARMREAYEKATGSIGEAAKRLLDPIPRPPADRCTCVGECRNCGADKLGEAFASWAEFEPYLIGGIRSHLMDHYGIWEGTEKRAPLLSEMPNLTDIAEVMARYFRIQFDIDSVKHGDWKPPTDDPTSVDEFLTARDHVVRVRRSDAYDPAGAWLSTTRSNYGAHLSVEEVRRTIRALAAAAEIGVGIPARPRSPEREVAGNPWAASAPLPEPSGSQHRGWVRLTLPLEGLEMAACPDRMNEIPHEAHSWGEFEDGIMKIRDSKIWWCVGCDGPSDQVDSEKTPGALGG